MMKHLFSIRFTLVPVNMILLLLINGCTVQYTQPTPPLSPEPTTGISVPFQNVVKGYKLGGTLTQPTLLVAYDRISLDKLASFISKKDQTSLELLDLKKETVVAVFLGVMPSGGTSITIRDITIKGNELTINLVLLENDPNFPKIEAATLPYHLVIIDHDVLPSITPFKYRLVSNNEVLVTGEEP